MVTIESLIEEGNKIRDGIMYIPPTQGVIRLFNAYKVPDTKAYGIWKNKVIRYLDKCFKGDRCINDFEKAILNFEKHNYSPSLFDDAIGIIVSCQVINNCDEPRQETEIERIYSLETSYEKKSCLPNDVNTQEAIDAFHKWYDALVRYLGKYFDNSNDNFKKIITVQTNGNGYTLKSVFEGIKTIVHLLLDQVENPDCDTPTITKKPAVANILSKKVFIVHGHDNEMKLAVVRLLEKLNLEPIILNEIANQGRTIIEKFEEESNVGFAVVLMSDQDDRGAEVCSSDYKPRARQNVILELGYFIGKLGRNRVFVLKKGDVEIPSDILGVVLKKYSSNDNGWMFNIAQELKSAGYYIDANLML